MYGLVIRTGLHCSPLIHERIDKGLGSIWLPVSCIIYGRVPSGDGCDTGGGLRVQVMKVRKSKPCVDGTTLREDILEGPVPRDIIGYLENFGTTKALADIRQPFYAFHLDNFFSIKGMVDDTSMFVRYESRYLPHTEEFFTCLITSFNHDSQDIGAGLMKCIELIEKICPGEGP